MSCALFSGLSLFPAPSSDCTSPITPLHASPFLSSCSHTPSFGRLVLSAHAASSHLHLYYPPQPLPLIICHLILPPPHVPSLTLFPPTSALVVSSNRCTWEADGGRGQGRRVRLMTAVLSNIIDISHAAAGCFGVVFERHTTLHLHFETV